MILIFEQDTREHDGRRWDWRPELFRGPWGPGRTWRFGWGLWSLTYIPEPGLRPFLDRVAAGGTEWRK